MLSRSQMHRLRILFHLWHAHVSCQEKERWPGVCCTLFIYFPVALLNNQIWINFACAFIWITNTLWNCPRIQDELFNLKCIEKQKGDEFSCCCLPYCTVFCSIILWAVKIVLIAILYENGQMHIRSTLIIFSGWRLGAWSAPAFPFVLIDLMKKVTKSWPRYIFTQVEVLVSRYFYNIFRLKFTARAQLIYSHPWNLKLIKKWYPRAIARGLPILLKPARTRETSHNEPDSVSLDFSRTRQVEPWVAFGFFLFF